MQEKTTLLRHCGTHYTTNKTGDSVWPSEWVIRRQEIPAPDNDSVCRVSEANAEPTIFSITDQQK
jgi:hypothetical protein